MKGVRILFPLALMALSVNCGMAQIMPWENRTETDDSPFAESQGVKKDKLYLEDVVGGTLIQTKGAGAINWLKDGNHYSRLEPSADGKGSDVVSYRVKDNKREVLIPASSFIDKATGKAVPVSSIIWSEDNGKVLVFTNTRKVWRYHTRGDYWVLDLKTGMFRKLGSGLPEATLMFAKFSPDGNRVAYVSNNNIYVEDVATGDVNQITRDGNKDCKRHFRLGI